MTDSNVSVPSGKSTPFLNGMMKLLLKTPLLQSFVGRQLALLTFTGRRTGKDYTIPISYQRRGNTVLMITKKFRSWWKNFTDRPTVEIRLAGKAARGTAEAHLGTSKDLTEVVDFLTGRPVDAKAYGVALDANGSPSPEEVEALLPQIVLVHVDLA